MVTAGRVVASGASRSLSFPSKKLSHWSFEFLGSELPLSKRRVLIPPSVTKCHDHDTGSYLDGESHFHNKIFFKIKFVVFII